MLKKLFKILHTGRSSDPAATSSTTEAGLAEAEALIAAGRSAEDAGRLQEAEGLYVRAAGLAPQLPAAHLNLGIARESLGDESGARECYQRVLVLEPGHPFGAYNLGKLEYMAGRLQAAEGLLRQAVAARAEFAEAWVLLSNVLDASDRAEAAAEAIERAVQLRPDDAGAWYNQAVILRGLGRLDGAAVAAARAAQLAPGEPEYVTLHMLLLYTQGFVAEALQPLRAAIQLAPHRLDLRSRELFLLNLVEAESPQQLFERHVRLGRELEAVISAYSHPRPLVSKSRLRIGLVSEDFCFHPVALFLLPWLEQRSRERFEVVCYSSTPGDSEITRRIRGLADRWVDATQMHDLELAEAIRADAIDVLLDLGGHTGHVRVGTFAAKPAPVQGSWMGYLNTSGLSRMDFRITDVRCDPSDTAQALHTERLMAMPQSQWCYRPFLQLDHAQGAPCEHQGFVTFGSFNNVTKITEPMAARWGRILRGVPASRLLIAGVQSLRKREALLQAIVASGIDPQRVEFAPRLDLAAYYQLMDRVDIALDSYPYGGGTTTFDALWMGLPVLAATGPTSASRSAASVLALLGLQQWVAPGIDRYEALAIERAGDPAAIGALRRSLRDRMRRSPLMDERRFVSDFEALLQRAWSDASEGGAAMLLPRNTAAADAHRRMQ